MDTTRQIQVNQRQSTTKMKTNCVLNRLLVASAITAFASIAGAATITLSGSVSPNPDAIAMVDLGESFILPTTYTDWLLGTGNQKLGGGITSSAPSSFSDSTYPNFTYSDGTLPPSGADENSTYRYSGGASFSLMIPVEAGSGRVILWLGATSDNSASFTADLPDTAGVEFSTNFGLLIREQWFLDYTSPVAQTMTVTIDRGTNANAGFFAVATTVPEPSSIIFLLGGMAICLRRRIAR